MIEFCLNAEEIELADKFIKECDAKELELQKADVEFCNSPFKSVIKETHDSGYPYHGAIGGAVSYEFGSTSLGSTVKIHYNGSHVKVTKDITDYDSW